MSDNECVKRRIRLGYLYPKPSFVLSCSGTWVAKTTMPKITLAVEDGRALCERGKHYYPDDGDFEPFYDCSRYFSVRYLGRERIIEVNDGDGPIIITEIGPTDETCTDLLVRDIPSYTDTTYKWISQVKEAGSTIGEVAQVTDDGDLSLAITKLQTSMLMADKGMWVIFLGICLRDMAPVSLGEIRITDIPLTGSHGEGIKGRLFQGHRFDVPIMDVLPGMSQADRRLLAEICEYMGSHALAKAISNFQE